MTTEGFTSDAEKIEYLVRKNMESSQANRKLIEEKILIINQCNALISCIHDLIDSGTNDLAADQANDCIKETRKLLNKVDPQYV